MTARDLPRIGQVAIRAAARSRAGWGTVRQP